MKRAAQHSLAVPLLLIGLAGCVGPRPSHISQSSAPKRALTAEVPDDVDFGSPPPGPTETHRAHPTVIGLYGELIAPSPDAGAPGDGASNVTQVSFVAEGAVFDPQVDRDGTMLVYASTQHRQTADIYVRSVTGTTQTQLTSDPADDLMPAFTPDGQQIAFCSDRSGNFDIYLLPARGGKAQQLTNDPAHELHPSFSPDGRKLVYSRFGEQSQRWELWVIDLTQPQVRHFVDYGLFPQWCPDPTQTKILFQRARKRGSRYHGVWTIDFINGEGSRPTEIVSAANAATINPSWAPDGRHIVFSTVVEPESGSDRPNQADLWIVSLDGSTRVNLTNGRFADYQPTWGGNGRVYFVSDRSGTDNIWSAAPSWPTGDMDESESFATVAEEQQ